MYKSRWRTAYAAVLNFSGSCISQQIGEIGKTQLSRDERYPSVERSVEMQLQRSVEMSVERQPIDERRPIDEMHVWSSTIEYQDDPM